MPKKYYQVDIVDGGKVETLVFKRKREKEKWLADYLTAGDFASAFRKLYDDYLIRHLVISGKALDYTDFLKVYCKQSHIRLTANFKILLVREKSF